MRQTIHIELNFLKTLGNFRILGIYQRGDTLITVCKIYKSEKNHGEPRQIIESISIENNKNEILPVKYYIINPIPKREEVAYKFHYYRVTAIEQIKEIIGLKSLETSAPVVTRKPPKKPGTLFLEVRPFEWDLNESPSITSNRSF